MENGFRPIGDRVLVQLTEAPKTTPGGLHIPETAKEREVRGVVLAVGPGRVTDAGVRLPMTVAKGDRVLIEKYQGSKVESRVGHRVEGERYVVREDQILGVETT